MANQEHLNILKQGVDAWNAWRRTDSARQPDLSNADLSSLQLVLLDGGDVIEIDLSGTNLSGTVLWWTDLTGANLSKANLNKANLMRSLLIGTDLREAKLTGAKLNAATFDGASLKGANFSQATLLSTIFVDVDLSLATGLETVTHAGPSSIGIDTIYRSQGNISEMFLRGAGVPDSFITYAHSLVGKSLDFYSCFISYSNQDDAFAHRLYADLQNKGVRCWFAPEDLKIGDKLRHRIAESIRLYDKLLLVLSEHSVASQWVEQEVETALEQERKEHRTVLFPIRLDNAVMEIEGGWPTLIRNTRNIGDFTYWKDHDAYQKAFKRVMRDLKAESQEDRGNGR